MQVRLSLMRFPSFVFGVVFALVASLILGGVLGYVLKPVQVETIYVPVGASSPDDNGCVWVDKIKEC